MQNFINTARKTVLTAAVAIVVTVGSLPGVGLIGVSPALAQAAGTNGGGGGQGSIGRVRMREIADDYQRVNTMFGVMEEKNADTAARIEEAAKRMAELPDPATMATAEERLAAETAVLKEAAVFIRGAVEFYDTQLGVGQDAYAVLQSAVAKIETAGGAGASNEAKALFDRTASYFESLKGSLVRVHAALAKNPGDKLLLKNFQDVKSRLDTVNQRLAHMQTVSRQSNDGATYAVAVRMVGDSLRDLRGSLAALQGEREYALYLKEILEAKAASLMGTYFNDAVRRFTVSGLGDGGTIGQGIQRIEKFLFDASVPASASSPTAPASGGLPELPKYPSYVTR